MDIEIVKSVLLATFLSGQPIYLLTNNYLQLLRLRPGFIYRLTGFQKVAGSC